MLQDVLGSVPEQTPSMELKPWLSEDLVPYVIRKAPDGLVCTTPQFLTYHVGLNVVQSVY